MSTSDAGLVDFLHERSHLRLLAGRITRSSEDAEDVLQEVWTRYDRHRRDVTNPAAWLHTVTSRAAIDRARQRSRRRETPMDRLADMPAIDAGPEQLALERERLTEAAWRLLERLSCLERAVFVGRELCDLDYDELAARLGRSEPALRQLRRRATRHLEDGVSRFTPTPGGVAQLAAHLWHAGRNGCVEELLDHLLADVSLAG